MELDKKDKDDLDRTKQLSIKYYNEWQEQQNHLEQEYKRLQLTFGHRDDFAIIAFLRSLRSLTSHAENLAIQFRTMSQAFDGAREAFASDYFQQGFLTIPINLRATAMKDLTECFQICAMVGYDQLQKPLQALILKEATKYDNDQKRYSNSQQNQKILAIENDDISGPHIEEAIDVN